MNRPLEYFKPLGEWIDVDELTFKIPEESPGGRVVPLVFEPYSRDQSPPEPAPTFVPYGLEHFCYPTDWPNTPEPTAWSYTFRHEDATVRILGNNPGDEGPDLGIHVALGSAEGVPGDVVEIPILAASEKPISELWIALRVDPDALRVDAVDMEILREATGTFARQAIARGEAKSYRECIDEDEDGVPDFPCTVGLPLVTQFHETENQSVLLAIYADPAGVWSPELYPGPVLREIGRLLVRVHETATAQEAGIEHAPVAYDPGGGFLVDGVTGGHAHPRDPETPFSRAREARPATVTILSGSLVEEDFVRGDANGDERVDLSDAVATLNYLFQGGEKPACLDAADSDDSGDLQITDAIFHLGVLFLGRGPFPAPHLECGRDPTRDALGCRQGCSERQGF